LFFFDHIALLIGLEDSCSFIVISHQGHTVIRCPSCISHVTCGRFFIITASCTIEGCLVLVIFHTCTVCSCYAYYKSERTPGFHFDTQDKIKHNTKI